MLKKKYSIAEAARILKISKAAVHAATRRKDHPLEYEWGEAVQTITIRRRAKFIPADALESYLVSESHQARGKKPR